MVISLLHLPVDVVQMVLTTVEAATLHCTRLKGACESWYYGCEEAKKGWAHFGTPVAYAAQASNWWGSISGLAEAEVHAGIANSSVGVNLACFTRGRAVHSSTGRPTRETINLCGPRVHALAHQAR